MAEEKRQVRLSEGISRYIRERQKAMDLTPKHVHIKDRRAK